MLQTNTSLQRGFILTILLFGLGVTVATSEPIDTIWDVSGSVDVTLEPGQHELVLEFETDTRHLERASEMSFLVQRLEADPEQPGPQGWGVQLEGGEPASQELVWGQGGYGTPFGLATWSSRLACASGIERCVRTFTLWRPEEEDRAVPLRVHVKLSNPALEEEGGDAVLRVLP